MPQVIMVQIGPELIQHLHQLACMESDPDQLATISTDLQHLLTLFDQLSEIPTEGVHPFTHTAADESSPLKADHPSSLPPAQALLINAPKRVGNFICIPPIFAGDS